jgi:hypothetical protein
MAGHKEAIKRSKKTGRYIEQQRNKRKTRGDEVERNNKLSS